MELTGRLVPPDLETLFHTYDRALRQNRALRALHGPLEGDEQRPPTGRSAAALAEENARLRAALEGRGVALPHLREGAVQPTTLLDVPRRHIPVAEPEVCPLCGAVRAGRTCRCGFAWDLERPPELDAGAASPWQLEASPPLRRRPRRWDAALAQGLAVVVVLAGLFWLVQPFFR